MILNDMRLKIYGRHGNVFARKDRFEDATSHNNLRPSSPYAISYINELQTKNNNELLERAFRTISVSKYGNAIFENFIHKDGRTIAHKFNVWNDFMSGKENLLNAIEDILKENHSSFHLNSGEIDLSNAIRSNWPSFRTSFVNLSEMIAIGGVQEVEVYGEIKG